MNVWPSFGNRSEAWLYRQLIGLSRYQAHILTRAHPDLQERLQEFPWPAERLITFPQTSRLRHFVSKLPACIRSGTTKVMSGIERRFIHSTVDELSAQILHLHFGWTATAVLEWLHEFAPTIVVSLYGTDVFASNAAYRRRLKKLLKKPIDFIVTSHALKAAMLELGAEDSRVTVVPVGVALDDFPSVAEVEEYRTQCQGPIRIITVGRLNDFKAPHKLPQVARFLIDRGLDFDWKLIGDGPYRPLVESETARLDVGRRFHIMGSRPFSEVKDRLWNADIMVHNAVVMPNGARESLGVALMEAGALGLPIVSCQVGGIPEVVIDGETGFLVEEGDLEAMAEKAVLLAGDKDLRYRMGMAAAGRVRSTFDSRKLAAQVEDLYDQILLNRKNA